MHPSLAITPPRFLRISCLIVALVSPAAFANFIILDDLLTFNASSSNSAHIREIVSLTASPGENSLTGGPQWAQVALASTLNNDQIGLQNRVRSVISAAGLPLDPAQPWASANMEALGQVIFRVDDPTTVQITGFFHQEFGRSSPTATLTSSSGAVPLNFTFSNGNFYDGMMDQTMILNPGIYTLTNRVSLGTITRSVEIHGGQLDLNITRVAVPEVGSTTMLLGMGFAALILIGRLRPDGAKDSRVG